MGVREGDGTEGVRVGVAVGGVSVLVGVWVGSGTSPVGVAVGGSAVGDGSGVSVGGGWVGREFVRARNPTLMEPRPVTRNTT